MNPWEAVEGRGVPVLKLKKIIIIIFAGVQVPTGKEGTGLRPNYAWPNAEIAVMGAAGACNILPRVLSGVFRVFAWL